MTDRAAVLLSFVDRFLPGESEFAEFAQRYYDHCVDTVPGHALSDEQRQFFFAVQEKLDWTDADPDDESRRYGWITPREYVRWLREARFAAYRDK